MFEVYVVEIAGNYRHPANVYGVRKAESVATDALINSSDKDCMLFTSEDAATTQARRLSAGAQYDSLSRRGETPYQALSSPNQTYIRNSLAEYHAESLNLRILLGEV